MKDFDPIHSPSDFGRLILAVLFVMLFLGDVKRRDQQTAGQPFQVEAVEKISPAKKVVVVVGDEPAASTPSVVDELTKKYGHREIIEKIINKFGEEDGQKAVKLVFECENKSVNPEAENHNANGTKDWGLFQINSIHGYSKKYLFNIDNNINIAHKIFKRHGWSAWTCAWVLGEKPFYEK